MSEQPSIFDESFDAAIAIRRRQLLPLFLKIYLLLMLIIGILMVISRIYTFYQMQAYYKAYGASWLFNYNALCLMILKGLTIHAAIIAMVICLWMEWKWAIRFSWGVLIGWLIMTITEYITDSGYHYDFYAGILALVLAPYYATLYQVQRRWEQEAVRRR
jgi:Na+/H+-translocating membrane pyrophosphatase